MLRHNGSWSPTDPNRPRWDDTTDIENEYPYHDENRRELYRKVKGRRADGEKVFITGQLMRGNDLQIAKADQPRAFFNYRGLTNYLRGDGGLPPVLYRLPELIEDMAARPDDPVFVLEGEKDVETARSHGLIATTNPNGAGKWDARFNRYFHGRDVVVIADNDQKGREHAFLVANHIARYATTTKIVRLPGVDEHGDLTEFIEAGANVPDLLELVEKADTRDAGASGAAGDYGAPGPQDGHDAQPLPLIDAGSLAGKAVEPMEFIVHKLVPANLVTLFTARGGGGKSHISMKLCASVSTGALAYGMTTTQAPAIYITAEDDDAENHRRMIGVANALNTSLETFARKLFLLSLVDRREKGLVRIDQQTNKMTILPLFYELRRSILDTGARLVVLDNVAHLFEGNENVRAHVAAFIGLLNALALECRCAIILVSHPNKAGDSFSGSTAFQNQVRSHIHLEVDQNNPDVRELSLQKANYARLENPLVIQWHRGAFRLQSEIPPDENEATGRERMEEQRFLECLKARNEAKRPVSVHGNVKTFAPREFVKMSQAGGMTFDQLELAMERLLERGVIEQSELDFEKENSRGHKATGLRQIVMVEPSDEPF